MTCETNAGERRIEDVIVALARERLTKKQKHILAFITEIREPVTVTKLVGLLEERLNCSASSLWLNLKSLRRCQLLEFGDRRQKGIPVRISEAGRMVSFSMKEVETCGTEK